MADKKETRPAYTELGLIKTTVGERTIYQCDKCGGAVAHLSRHDAFHRILDAVSAQANAG